MNYNRLLICGIASFVCLFVGCCGKMYIKDYWRYPFLIIGIILFLPLAIYVGFILP